MAHSTVPAITKDPHTDRRREPVTSASAPSRSATGSLLKSLRPAQWTKNLIVFAGLLFGQVGGGPAFLNPRAIAKALAAFFIFCALSGVVYLINDVADREADRLHPLKRHRPIASGAVSPGLAIGTAIVLVVAALAGAWLLRPAFALIAVVYVALLALYSGPLKHVVIIDVLTIAIGFVLRAAAGAAAINVAIDHWLLILTILLALFLALSKRRHELPVPARPDDRGGHRVDPRDLRHLDGQRGNRAEVPHGLPRADADLPALRDLPLPVSRSPEGGRRQSGGHAVERPSPAGLRGALGRGRDLHHLWGSIAREWPNPKSQS
jgi:hypothetical protein